MMTVSKQPAFDEPVVGSLGTNMNGLTLSAVGHGPNVGPAMDI